MKKILVFIFSCFILSINAQTITFNPRTGDTEFDNVLKDINDKAKSDINSFIQTAVNVFNTTKDKVEALIKDIPTPADVYMVLQTAEVTNKPVEEVKTVYTKNKDKGWGQIAKELGIKPGSAEFHALKGKVKNHGKGKDKAKDKGGNGKGKGKKS